MTNTKMQNLKLESGRLCLDFANTLDWHASEHPIERLNTYADFVAWSKSIGSAAWELPRNRTAKDGKRLDRRLHILRAIRSARGCFAHCLCRRSAPNALRRVNRAIMPSGVECPVLFAETRMGNCGRLMMVIAVAGAVSSSSRTPPR